MSVPSLAPMSKTFRPRMRFNAHSRRFFAPSSRDHVPDVIQSVICDFRAQTLICESRRSCLWVRYCLSRISWTMNSFHTKIQAIYRPEHPHSLVSIRTCRTPDIRRLQRHSFPFFPEFVTRRQPIVEFPRHLRSKQVPILRDAMSTHVPAIHDGRETAIPIVDLSLLKEPAPYRRKILIETSGRALAYLTLDFLPENDAVSIFERLPKLHQFEHVGARCAAHLDTGLGEVTRERKVRVPDPFRGVPLGEFTDEPREIRVDAANRGVVHIEASEFSIAVWTHLLADCSCRPDRDRAVDDDETRKELLSIIQHVVNE